MASDKNNDVQSDFANMRDGALTAAAHLLESSSEYQILRKLKERSSYFPRAENEKVKFGVILDTETTGFKTYSDVLIEIGMIKFEYNEESGQVFNVVDTFDELEAPGFPIPHESVRIHGITDEMVLGKKINEERLNAFMSDVDLVVAHNAKFDRPFAEKRFPVFAHKRWGCSLEQINWREEGIESGKLQYLAYKYGFFYGGHRALEDCRALLEVLQQPLQVSGDLALRGLLREASRTSYRIYALSAPFGKKDLLKERGYRWEAVTKVWHSAELSLPDKTKEIEWLKAKIYAGKSVALELEEIDADARFSGRKSVIITQTI
jgi:DNA polymerase-3 subunit epsilon